MALTEGKVTESENYGKRYILMLEGWGAIVYYPGIESIMLTKGTRRSRSSVDYNGKYAKYSVSQVIEGGKPEVTFVDWSVAMDIPNKYLREIETVKGK